LVVVRCDSRIVPSAGWRSVSLSPLMIIHDDRPILFLDSAPARAAYDITAVTGVQLTPAGRISVVNAQLR
jgi:hypothetical protein